MFISPNEDNTAVHGCHCLGDMILCMRKVLAIPQSWYFNAEIGIVFDNFVPGFSGFGCSLAQVFLHFL